MKDIKNFINESFTSEDPQVLINYIQEIIDQHKNDLDKDELSKEMEDVRNHIKEYSDWACNKIERHFKIKKNYPNTKTNIEMWVMSKICKK